jgi:glyoxylase-like metal-dependent hydrolase (beta-lactamase superfamily II)
VVETEDAVLVCDKNVTQDVKKVFDKLKQYAISQNELTGRIENLEKALDGREPEYLVVQHLEPDHSGNINTLLKMYEHLIQNWFVLVIRQELQDLAKA